LEEAVTTPEKELIKREICGRSPAFCQVAAYVESSGGFGEIVKNKRVPKGKMIPGMEISKTLEDK
jgi:hypothetical protein